jgi:hypothetical protein
LEAVKALPDVLVHRSRLPAKLVPGRLVDADVVNGPWKRLVFGHPVCEPARLRFLRAGAVLARPEAPRDLRRHLRQVAHPPRPNCWKARSGRRLAAACRART